MLTVLGIPLLEFLYLFGSLSVSFSSIEYDTPHSIHLPLLYTHTHTHIHFSHSLPTTWFLHHCFAFFFLNLRMMHQEQLQSTKDESMDVTLVKGNPISQVRWDKKERKKATEAITAH